MPMGLVELQDLAESKALEYGLDPKAVAAIITVESSWRPKTARYEKNFPYVDRAVWYAKMHGISVATETVLQSCSWGLMQVMGGTARSPLNYQGWLPDLCEPELGIDLGCRYFQTKCLRYSKPADQFAAYNAGSVTLDMNGQYSKAVQDYVKKIMAAYARY